MIFLNNVVGTDDSKHVATQLTAIGEIPGGFACPAVRGAAQIT
jgi:hypothetical protein